MVKNICKSVLAFSLVAVPVYLSHTVHVPKSLAATLACVDGDGANIYTASQVETTTQYDANGNVISIGEIAPDKCLTLSVTQNGGVTSSQWISGATGTHVEEATCTDGGATGSITYTVHECLGGCINGACQIVSDPSSTPAYTVSTTKVEGKGIVTAVQANSIKVADKVLHIGPETIIKLNYQSGFAVGQKAEYKGFLNSDNSVTVSKIEVNVTK